MAKRGKPRLLDEIKKGQILAILAVGCSRRVAADYVGCSQSAIQNTARRDPTFAEALRRAEHQVEVGYLRNIQKAASQEKHWRAAAWALERHNPQDYARRSPEAMSIDQVKELIAQCAGIVVEEVPVAEYRKRIVKRVGRLLRSLGLPQAKQSRNSGGSRPTH